MVAQSFMQCKQLVNNSNLAGGIHGETTKGPDVYVRPHHSGSDPLQVPKLGAACLAAHTSGAKIASCCHPEKMKINRLC